MCTERPSSRRLATYNKEMGEEGFKVTVDKDLEDLIPVFMSNRHKEIDTLKVAVAAADFEQLRHLGHRMKGVGDSYGFNQVSLFGRQIEEHACGGDCAAIEATIEQYRGYLAKVHIVYE